ncbi:MAG: cytochrome c [Azospirillum sp.]|nr:cytochrome c [Azospirillum sp.]
MLRLATTTAVLLLLAGPALAGEENIKLADGPNLMLVEGHCGACHSLDYIPMNSPFLDRTKWQGTVTKMIKVYGAPIADDEAVQIIDYLAARYGG